MTKLFLIGIIVGLGKILPGVSGAVLAMMLGVYELLINSVANFQFAIKNFKKLFPLILGIIISILLTSIFMSYIANKFYHILLSFIVGIMIYETAKNIKEYRYQKINLKYVLISSLFILFSIGLVTFKGKGVITNESSTHLFISLILCGLLDAISTIVPGISGTAILLMLGYYQKILISFSKLDFSIIIPFGLGFIIGIIIFSKIFVNLIKKHKALINYIITIFCLWSTTSLLINTIRLVNLNNFLTIVISMIFGLISIKIISKKLA